ncbi:MAG: FliM/FliN family flagellar motor switch protein [Pseudomonadota bacterium]
MTVDPLTGEMVEEIEWGDNDTVDGMLGFRFDEHETQDRSGLRGLINSSMISHPAAPALELVFDRVPPRFTKCLRHLANDALDVSLETVATVRFSEFLGERTEGSVLGLFQSDSLDNYSLLCADPVFVYSLVDILMGGARVQGAGDVARSYTSIEIALISRIFEALCTELTRAFDTIVEAPFTLAAVVTNPRFAAITRENAVCALAKCRVDVLGVRGQLHILMPYANLEPVRDRLHKDRLTHAVHGQRHWKDILNERVRDTKLELSCVLAERVLTLRDIEKLSVGDVLSFDQALHDPVSLSVGRHQLASGQIGRAGERFAVRLDQSGAQIREKLS